MPPSSSVPIEVFDHFYASRTDPYGMEARWYERRKRSLTLALLADEHYGTALELACGEGWLTEPLARRCGHLVATEASSVARRRARERFADRPDVTVVDHTLPDPLPWTGCDLVVLAEVGYFLSARDLVAARDHLVGALRPNGELVAVHWRHPSPDYPLDGATVHSLLDASDQLTPAVHLVDPDFVADSWRRSAAD